MYCSPPGSSLHGILQARVLERVAISFSRGSSRPRDRTRVSWIPGRHFNLWATREAPKERCNALDPWFFYSFCLGNQVPPSSLIPLAQVPTTGHTAHSPVAVWRADTTAATTLGNGSGHHFGESWTYHPLSSSLFTVSRSYYLQDNLGPIGH